MSLSRVAGTKAARPVLDVPALGLAPPVQGEARLYAGERSGLIVNLPRWRYPVVVEMVSATVHFANFSQASGMPRRRPSPPTRLAICDYQIANGALPGSFCTNHIWSGYSTNRATFRGANQLFLDGHVAWKPGRR